MGFLDRLDDAWDAARDFAGNVAQETGDQLEDVYTGAKRGVHDIAIDGVAGLFHDLVTQPWQEAERGDTNVGSAVLRGLGRATQDVGQIGLGFAKITTSPLRAIPMHETLDLLDGAWGYVDRGTATLLLNTKLTMSDLAKGDWETQLGLNEKGQHRLETASEMREKYEMSLGNALSTVLNPSLDLENEQDVYRYQQGTFYTITSVLGDVLVPFIIDPALPVLSALRFARVRSVVKPVAGKNLDAVMASQDLKGFKTSIEGLSYGEVATKYAHKGITPEQADIIVKARDSTPGALDLHLRNLLGDPAATRTLTEMRDHTVAAAERLKGNLDDLLANGSLEPSFIDDYEDLRLTLGHPDITSVRAPYRVPSQSSVSRLEAELAQTESTLYFQNRATELFGSMENIPHTSRYTEARFDVLRSDWWQNGTTSTPFRMLYQRYPPGLLNLDDPDSVTGVQQFLDHSALDNATKDAFVTRWINTPSGLAKLDLYDEMDNAATLSILNKHNLSDNDIDAALSLSKAGRTHMNGEVLRVGGGRVYDGNNRGVITVIGDGGKPNKRALPLHITQDANLVSFTDLTRLDKVAGRISPNKIRDTFLSPEGKVMREKLLDGGAVALREMQNMWKASVLLRAAYPLRVVGEEQFRIVGLYGALMSKQWLTSGFRNSVQDVQVVRRETRLMEKAYERETGRVPGSMEKQRIHNHVRKQYKAEEWVPGRRDASYGGYDFEPALGGELGGMWRHLASSGASYDGGIGRDAARRAADIKLYGKAASKSRGTGTYTITPPFLDDGVTLNPKWGTDWLLAVQRQIAPDPASRLILQGKSKAWMLNWLSTPEGRKYERKLAKEWQNNPERWLDEKMGAIDDYLPTPALRQGALSGSIDRKLAEREWATQIRPNVHGEALEALNAGHWMLDVVNKITQTGYRYIAQMPTDRLSRNQVFDTVYTLERKRLVDNYAQRTAQMGDTIRLTDKQLADITQQARTKALREVKRNLFDLAAESDLSHALKFISPFFNAFEETLRVWGRIAVQNPRFAEQMRNVWEAPDRAGLVHETDYGSVIIIPTPAFTIPGVGKIDDIKLSKRGLNTILNLPGVGPLVTAPVAELTKNRPDLQSTETARIIYPYGLPANWKQAFTSTSLRNFAQWANPDYENARYLRIWNSIHTTELIRYQQGLRSTAPTRDEIDGKAGKMSLMKLLVDSTSPTQTQFGSPYDPYKEIYNKLMDENPSTADQRFYELHGEEFIALTTSIYDHISGLPSTLEGFQAWKDNPELIRKYPEYGGLIAGDDAFSGEFNQAVQQWMLHTPLKPYAPVEGDRNPNLLELRSPEELMLAPKVEAGWLKFREFNNYLYTELEKRGLTRLTDKGAKDLRAKKSDYVNLVMKEKYKEWYTEYSTANFDSSRQRIMALSEIAFDPRMSGRREMEGLREYIESRQSLVRRLEERKANGGSSTLVAQSNTDLRDAWDGYTSDLVRRNQTFAPLFFRYLDTDKIQAGQ